MTRDIKHLDIDGWPLPNDYLVEVGRIALLWARLEKFVSNAVANFVGFENLADPKAYIVFTSPSFERNLELLEKLCALLSPTTPNLVGYETVLRDLRAAREAANLYIKGGMTPNPGDGSVEIDFSDPLDPSAATVKTVTIADLRDAIMCIDEAQHALYKLVIAIERPDRRIAR